MKGFNNHKDTISMRVLLILLPLLMLLTLAVANTALAEDQIVTLTPAVSSEAAGDGFILTAMYDVSNDDSTLSTLTVRFHYDSTKLQFDGFTNSFATSLLGEQGATDDTGNTDGDATTDKYVQIAWFDFTVNWPGQALPLALTELNFTLSGGASDGDSTPVNVSFTAWDFLSHNAVGNNATVNINKDSDGDGTDDSEDFCPNDPDKAVDGGQCGCGVADTDSDSDGTADCNDVCDNDPTKTTDDGQCGCDVAETDTDSDGTADCNDVCDNDPTKTTDDGQCGCGVPETDTDDDGTADCNDQCPNDDKKTEPGDCGCGFTDSDDDTDGDGTPDCSDPCPLDNPDDTDQDGTCDSDDECPTDPNKTEPGDCGCGEVDTDTDSDGTADCAETCDDDPNKLEPGICGCGTADTDTDSDGTADCNETCDDDPNKLEPGLCGCGVVDSDADTDQDGTIDCNDVCPDDESKDTDAGQCGCGELETDTDSDGTADCIDQCDDDPDKTDAGLCGCGEVDDATDTDEDGTLDCNETCIEDPNKTEPGICGCGRSDTDSDLDGIEDCNDNSPYTDNPNQEDTDGDGVGDASEMGPDGNDAQYDGNGDGTADIDQANVVSLFVNYGQEYVTLSTDAANQLQGVAYIPADEVMGAPDEADFPFGLFEFTLIVPNAGDTTTLTLEMPAGTNTGGVIAVNSYWKYGPTPANPAFDWYEFLYDAGPPETGAEFLDDTITLTFTDGERGDDDLVADAIVIDQGGPAFVAGNPAPQLGGGGGGGNNGGGCFIETVFSSFKKN